MKNKLALITGASRGIGCAIALELGRQGIRIIGSATTDVGAQKITQLLQDAKIEGVGICLNTGCDQSVNETMEYINKNYGFPEILVNNAGITRDNLLLRMKPHEWDEVIQVNLSGIYRMSKACLKGMTRNRWGRIINIGSVVGGMGNAGQTNYAASKSGIEGFSRSLAQEVGCRNITVNVIAPGFIETDMTKKMDSVSREKMLTYIPLQRLGKPKDIALTVAFLASDDGEYITGQTIHVNGGMDMK